MAEEKTTESPKKAQKKKVDFEKGGVLWVVWYYVEAVLLIVAGILSIVESANADFQKVLVILVGVFLILGGSLKILVNFLPIFQVEEKKDLSYGFVIGGAAELAFGITLVSNSAMIDALVTFASTLIGILAIVAGAVFLLFAIGFIIRKLYKIYMPILEIVLGLGLIALGVVILIYMGQNSETSKQVILIIVGVVLALAGVAIFVDTTNAMIIHNRARKAAAVTVAVAQDAGLVDKGEIDLTTKKDEQKPDDKNDPKNAGK